MAGLGRDHGGSCDMEESEDDGLAGNNGAGYGVADVGDLSWRVEEARETGDPVDVWRGRTREGVRCRQTTAAPCRGGREIHDRDKGILPRRVGGKKPERKCLVEVGLDSAFNSNGW